MPLPPQLILSASVPCGVSSSATSPDRYAVSRTLLDPINERIILEICLLLIRGAGSLSVSMG
jgi:hypothetical protein